MERTAPDRAGLRLRTEDPRAQAADLPGDRTVGRQEGVSRFAALAPTRGWRAWLLLFGASAALAALLLGGTALEYELPGGLPVGNALAALMLCSSAGAAVRWACPGSWPRAIAWCALGAAMIWLPVSILLAGNPALVFGNGRGDAWTVLTLATAVLVIASLLLAFAAALWRFLSAPEAA